MTLEEIVLYGLIALTAVPAAAILFVRSVFTAALLLIVCLVGLAGIYVLQKAEFLAATQIMIYAGGVLVLIIFGIMLTTRLSGKSVMVQNQNYFAGCMLAAAFFAVLIYSLITLPGANKISGQNAIQKVSSLGLLLFTEYAAPFEVAGVLLLVSLIAAAVIASHLLIKRDP